LEKIIRFIDVESGEGALGFIFTVPSVCGKAGIDITIETIEISDVCIKPWFFCGEGER
jgi:hypothetical protein